MIGIQHKDKDKYMNTTWPVDIFPTENVFLHEEINGHNKKMIKKVWYTKGLSMNTGTHNCRSTNESNQDKRQIKFNELKTNI